MTRDNPILDYEDANRRIDSDEAWARMSQLTGRETLSFWWLFQAAAVLFFLEVLVIIGLMISR